MKSIFHIFLITSCILIYYTCDVFMLVAVTQSLEEMFYQYEDDRNAMIAILAAKDDPEMYDDFYDEFDNEAKLEQSMNMIFFGPASSFLRLDAESILHILTSTKSNLIPITRALLAWDIITDGKTAAFLQGREFLAFGALLNDVPEEDLYYANFGDPSVLQYFANYYENLQPRKYGILAAAYRRYFGDYWYENSTNINELGYLLCGFPSTDLEKIRPTDFKDINSATLTKAGKCNDNQTQTLFNIAKHPDAYGDPYTWTSYEIGRLSTIFVRISNADISLIKLEAITAITPEVMRAIHRKKLAFFTRLQILKMNPKTRRIYMTRMQLKSTYDISELSKQQNGMSLATNKSLILKDILIVTLLVTFNYEYMLS